MEFKRIMIIGSLLASSIVLGETEMITTIDSVGDRIDATGTTVTSTASIEQDQTIAEAVQQVLKEGSYTGITVTVSAGNVILRGSVMEDKLQDLVNDISQIDRVGSVNVDSLITTKYMPSTPNLPINKPPPATGLVAPPPVGSSETN